MMSPIANKQTKAPRSLKATLKSWLDGMELSNNPIIINTYKIVEYKLSSMYT